MAHRGQDGERTGERSTEDQHADRRDGLGARDAGVGPWTLEYASLKCKGSVCRLVEEFNPLLP